MLYTVKYKKVGQAFWRKVKKVNADGITEDGKTRWLGLADETYLEFPRDAYVFKFSPERAKLIADNRRKENAQ